MECRTDQGAPGHQSGGIAWHCVACVHAAAGARPRSLVQNSLYPDPTSAAVLRAKTETHGKRHSENAGFPASVKGLVLGPKIGAAARLATPRRRACSAKRVRVGWGRWEGPQASPTGPHRAQPACGAPGRRRGGRSPPPRLVRIEKAKPVRPLRCAPCSHPPHTTTASASINTRMSSCTRRCTSTMVEAGRIAPNTSPCALLMAAESRAMLRT